MTCFILHTCLLWAIIVVVLVSGLRKDISEDFVTGDAKADQPSCQSPDCAGIPYSANRWNIWPGRVTPTIFGAFYSITRPFEMSNSSPAPTKDFNADHTVSPSPTTKVSHVTSTPPPSSTAATSTVVLDNGINFSFAGSELSLFENSPANVGIIPPSSSSNPLGSTTPQALSSENPDMVLEPMHSIVSSPSTEILQDSKNGITDASLRQGLVNELAQETPVTFVMPLSNSQTALPLLQMVANPAYEMLPLITHASVNPSHSSSPTPSPTPTTSPSRSASSSPSVTPSITPSPSTTPTPTTSPSPSVSPTSSPSAPAGPSCVCTDTCVDEYTRQYGGSCNNGVCVNQLTEDCSVSRGPLQCSADKLKRGVCLNSECTTEEYTCTKDPCDAGGIYTVPYTSTGGGARRQAGVSEVQVSGCSTAFCAASFAVQCGVQTKLGLCRKLGGAECQIVDNSGASV